MGRATRLLTRLRREDGFTIVELVMVSALSMILLASILSLLEGTTRTERATQARLSLELDVRGAMTQMSKDTRQALSIDPTSTRSHLVMQTLVGGIAKNVTYDVSGTDLRRVDTASGTTRVLVKHLTNGSPFCFDPPSCAATSPQSPTSIRITVSAVPAVSNVAVMTIQSDVELRNMR